MILWLSRKLSWIKRCLLKHLWGKDSCFHTLSQKNCCFVAKSEVWLFATPWTVDHQALLSMGFLRTKYWNGLPFPSPRELPNPEIESTPSAWQADSLPLSHLRSPSQKNKCTYMVRIRTQFWQNINNWLSVSFLGSKINAVTAATRLERRLLLKNSYDTPRQCIKKQRHHFANRGWQSSSWGHTESDMTWRLNSNKKSFF